MDESAARLERAGWTVGDVGTAGGGWLVTGTNGENQIQAGASSQAKAWHRAVEQARALGMLGKGS